MDVMTENKAVPKLRFREFNDIWQQKALEDVGSLVTGLTYSPKDITNDGVLVLRSSNVQNNQLAFEDNVYVNVESFNPVKENDILICVRNGSKRLIGKSCLIDKNNEGVAFGAFMTVYRSVNNKFISHLFSLSSYYKTIHQNLGATINSINNNDLKKFKFFFPSLDEQQKLASFLCAVDKKLQQLTRKKELLEEYKKGVMQQIFSQELRFKDNNGDNYPDWEEKRIGELFEERNEKNFVNMELLSVSINKGIFPQSKSNKKDNSNRDKSKYKRVLAGDIAYNSMRMWQGASAVSNLNGIISPAYTVLKSNRYNNSQYFGYLFKMRFMIQTFQKHSQGMTSDTWNLKYRMISPIKIKVPHLDVQIRVANFLSSLDSKIDLVSTQIENTKAFKKGLLQQMFV